MDIDKLLATLEANSATQATLSADIRASVEESRASRALMEKASTELHEVVAIGRDRIKVADERRQEAARAEVARIGVLSKAGASLWKVAQNPTAAILTALAVYIAAQWLGVHIPVASAQ